MGRIAVIDRATDRDAGIVDRFAEKCVSVGPGSSGAASLGAAGVESSSAGPAKPAIVQNEILQNEIEASEQSCGEGTEGLTPPIWFQLSEPERQRFGQCFSLIVLKALGLRHGVRSDRFTEEQS